MSWMFDIQVIKNKMENIYNQIPEFDCKHCHKCCGPIIWFKTEDILINDYLKKHNIENVKWTTDEFQKNEMKCPFLKNDRCVIYHVRPLVCRLQGNIADLPCLFNKNRYISEESIKKIKKEIFDINREFHGDNIFYSTRKMTKI